MPCSASCGAFFLHGWDSAKGPILVLPEKHDGNEVMIFQSDIHEGSFLCHVLLRQ
jgi:hypothetical protein